MSTLLFAFLASLALSLLSTWCARRVATRWGLVDHPDGRRKIHARPVPVAGGPAILFAATSTVALLVVFANPLQEQLHEQGRILLGTFLAAMLITCLGVLDDSHGLRGRHKLLGQICAVTIVLAFGVQVQRLTFFGWSLELGILALPFTMFWLLGAINSLNLIDGMDGLLGCVGLIVCLAMAAMALLGEHWAMACVGVAMAGALLGFLRFNFPPASIFLGDSGSMLIGLVVGILGIQCSLKGPATIALTAPLALMTIPILDTLLAITRRKLTGRSIYATDRGHLHHCLLRSGLSHRRALILVAVLCLVTMVGTLTSLLLRNELLAILSALAVVCMLIVSRLFGYAEMLLVTNRLRATAVSFLRLPPKGDAHETEVHLQGTAGWSELWRELTICVSPLNIMKMRLDVSVPAMHEGYHASWHRPDYDGDDPNLWRAEIPLSASGVSVGRLELTGRRGDEPVAARLATVAKLVEDLESAMGVLTEEPPIGQNGTVDTPLNGFELEPKRPGAALQHVNGKA